MIRLDSRYCAVSMKPLIAFVNNVPYRSWSRNGVGYVQGMSASPPHCPVATTLSSEHYTALLRSPLPLSIRSMNTINNKLFQQDKTPCHRTPCLWFEKHFADLRQMVWSPNLSNNRGFMGRGEGFPFTR